MLYDCFMFYNELEVLQLRLKELDDLADRFVLVESTRTLRNEPKKLFFKSNTALFEKYNHKIINVIVDDMPNSSNAWDLEAHLRNAMMRGLSDCGEEDVIMISDIDEIPRKSSVRTLVPQLGNEFVSLHMPQYYYYLNCQLPVDWVGTVVSNYGALKLTTPQSLRSNKERFKGIANAGWHFSYLGDIDMIVDKLSTFSHTEYDTPVYKDRKHIEQCLKDGKDLFRRGLDGVFVEIDASYPETVISDRAFFSRFIHPPDPQEVRLAKLQAGILALSQNMRVEIEGLNRIIEARDEGIAFLKSELDRANSELESIKSSRPYRLYARLSRVLRR